MDIQEEKEAFEQFKAKQIGIDYKDLKADLDDCERRFPKNRYAGWNFSNDWEVWQAAKASVVPEGFVLVPRLLSDEIADDLASDKFNNMQSLFDYEHRGSTAIHREQIRLRWCKNKAKEYQETYGSLIEAQELAND